MSLYGKKYYADQKYGNWEEFVASYIGDGLKHGHSRFLHSIHQHAFRLVAPIPNMKVIDVGCGSGQFLFQLAKAGCIGYGIDTSLSAMECFSDAARELDGRVLKRVHLIAMDAMDVENLRCKADVITMIDFVEHLSDDQLARVFVGIKKTLSVNGRIVIHTLPTRNYKLIGNVIVSLFSKGKIQYSSLQDEIAIGHINIQSRRSLMCLLQRHFYGQRIQVWYNMSNPESMWSRLGNAPGLRAVLSPSLWATVDIVPE